MLPVSSSSTLSSIASCSSCQLGKLAKLSFASVEHTTTLSFHIIHSDVWGSAHAISSSSSVYFELFVNDFTIFTWIYFLNNKSDFFFLFFLEF